MNETILRILTALIFLTGIGISIYSRSKADRETGERVSSRDEGAPIFLALRLGGLLLWLSTLAYLINPAWFEWSRASLPLWVRWLGIGLGIICDFLIFWLFRSIGSSISPTVGTRTNHQLVTHGIYRYVRHPLYSVGMAFFLSFALMADNWFFALLSIGAFVLLAIRLPNEEAHLIARFGDDYRNYMRTTGAFLPRLKR